MMKSIKLLSNVLRMGSHIFFLNMLTRPGSHEEGFNVFGYFSKLIGQGEVARGFIDDLIRDNAKFVMVDFYDNNHKRMNRREEGKYRKYYNKGFRYQTNVFFIDLMLLPQIRKMIPALFRNRHNVVVFWWEFESGFEDRIPILNSFDEVYVFSDFIKNVLNSIEYKTFLVTKIKYPFVKNWVIENEPVSIKGKYKLEEKFCFFFNFDYLSSYNRKNPEAILTALAEAFPNKSDTVFVVKTNNGSKFEEKENCFIRKLTTLGLNDRVIIVKDQLSRNGFMTLLNAMDCYISLHRGEGLGLGILEALALKKPVIATNYGGNSEYMNNPLAYSVPYSMVPANDDYGPYKNVKLWAEPDIKQAIFLMREVYNKFYLISTR